MDLSLIVRVSFIISHEVFLIYYPDIKWNNYYLIILSEPYKRILSSF